ncbi:hypothetical protein ACN47E_005026 [Coniothyrium glycines]
MLSRGGWHSGINDHSSLSLSSAEQVQIPLQNQWELSRYLSRQCAIAPNWTGNSIDNRSALTKTSTYDFENLANSACASEKGRCSNGLVITTSVCGRYLCVARETLIYIYRFEKGSIQALTSVVCPRRVLGISMDVSSDRHAIAALLEGRIGLVCELRYNLAHDAATSFKAEDQDCHATSTSKVEASSGADSRQSINFTDCATQRIRRHFPFIQAQDVGSFNMINVQSNYEEVDLLGTDNENNHEQNLINYAWNVNLTGPGRWTAAPASGICHCTLPVDTGTSTYYRHLCSEDDPPRSVAICPQRRCVAFGCSAGIELHWIDALTGQSLSRWFPLTAPSDHLYFLPPRPGLESARKLRLISSAAQPDDRPAIRRRFFSSRPMLGSLWGFGVEASSRRPDLQGFDHFHAVPLSDGHHVLFIDPSNYRLTFGCDAPLGGPTKLVRKVVFHPPGDNMVPKLFCAAADMSHGVMVAAVYGEVIMLYSIPPDICRLSQKEQMTDTGRLASTPSTAVHLSNCWLN